MSYLGHSLREYYFSAETQSVYSTTSADWANSFCGNKPDQLLFRHTSYNIFYNVFSNIFISIDRHIHYIRVPVLRGGSEIIIQHLWELSPKKHNSVLLNMYVMLKNNYSLLYTNSWFLSILNLEPNRQTSW